MHSSSSCLHFAQMSIQFLLLFGLADVILVKNMSVNDFFKVVIISFSNPKVIKKRVCCIFQMAFKKCRNQHNIFALWLNAKSLKNIYDMYVCTSCFQKISPLAMLKLFIFWRSFLSSSVRTCLAFDKQVIDGLVYYSRLQRLYFLFFHFFILFYFTAPPKKMPKSHPF